MTPAFRMTEADVQLACLRLMALRRVPCWRTNSGVLLNHDGRPVRFGFTGCPDLMFVVPGSLGRLGLVECKRPRGRPTAAQRATLAAFRAAGCVALIIDDVAQLQAALDRLAADPECHP